MQFQFRATQDKKENEERSGPTIHTLHQFFGKIADIADSSLIIEKGVREFLDTYFKAVKLSLLDSTYEDRAAKIIDSFGDKGSIIPDIITEQQFLHEIAQEFTTNTILTGNIRTDAISKGYTHLCTAVKYEMQQEIERMLGELDQKLLNKIKDSKFYK